MKTKSTHPVRQRASHGSRLPIKRSSSQTGSQEVTWGGEELDWDALLCAFVHPTKLWIIEALRCIDLPLSATQLERISDGIIGNESFSYHLISMVKGGCLYEVASRKVRGAEEKFFTFTDAVRL